MGQPQAAAGSSTSGDGPLVLSVFLIGAESCKPGTGCTLTSQQPSGSGDHYWDAARLVDHPRRLNGRRISVRGAWTIQFRSL
jgi:hypothetical protein